MFVLQAKVIHDLFTIHKIFHSWIWIILAREDFFLVPYCWMIYKAMLMGIPSTSVFYTKEICQWTLIIYIKHWPTLTRSKCLDHQWTQCGCQRSPFSVNGRMIRQKKKKSSLPMSSFVFTSWWAQKRTPPPPAPWSGCLWTKLAC